MNKGHKDKNSLILIKFNFYVSIKYIKQNVIKDKSLWIQPKKPEVLESGYKNYNKHSSTPINGSLLMSDEKNPIPGRGQKEK